MRTSAVAALVFANSQDELLDRLTEKRSMASVPFGGRYRLIDFTLSNLVNAKISNIGIITKGNYRSLMDHLGSGIFWDLDRKNGGLRLLPPYNTSSAKVYNGYVEALIGAMDFIHRSNAEYIVISESGIVANIDISAAISDHIKNNADVTVLYANGPFPDKIGDAAALCFDTTGRVEKLYIPTEDGQPVDYSLGIAVFTRSVLIKLIKEAYESRAFGIYRDVLYSSVNSVRIFGFRHDGYVSVMDSENSYYLSNMQLLKADVRKDLFNPDRPIYTKTRDDMPTRYGTKASVSNSFIADGCIIYGTVKNSILFRGVTVGQGAVVENSILMQGAEIGENSKINYAVFDKNSTVGSDVSAVGSKDIPFFLQKNGKV